MTLSLKGLPLEKDLVVDMEGFFAKFRSVQPFLQNDSMPPERERRHDTLKVNRDVCVQIVEAWREGYAVTLAERSRLTLDEVRAYFDDMIKCIRNPRGYAVWQIPIATGLKPRGR